MQMKLIRAYIEVRDKLLLLFSEEFDVPTEKVDLFANYHATPCSPRRSMAKN